MRLPFQPRVRTALAVIVLLCAGWGFPAEAGSRPGWWKPSEATAGVRLSVREMRRNKSDSQFKGHPSVTAVFSASGFPKDKRYELWGTWLDLRTARFITLSVDQKGDLRMVNPKSGALGPELGKIKLVLGNYAKGEPASYALVSTDRTVKAFARIIPFPLEARDRGCRLWMEIITSDGNTFALHGEGFEPGEEVQTLSRSNGERLSAKQKISTDGTFGPIIIAPATISGKHQASFTATGRSCSVKIKYKWGPPALEQE